MPWAPSSSTWSPRRSASWTSQVVSSRCGASRAPQAAACSTSASTVKPAAPMASSSRFLSGSARPIRSRRTSRSHRSSIRSPSRQARSPYGGPDPAPRRAHLRAAEPDLVGPVEGHVVRHDHVRAAADPHPRDVDALRRQHVELGDERGRVDDDAVADHGRDVRVQHARRAQLELERLVAHDDGVARVVAALVADDDGDVLGEEVGGLALALVAPLEAHDHGRGHQRGPDTKEPRTGPGSWIHVSRDSPRAFRRAGGSKVRARLTGRTPRLPRAMVISSIAGLAPPGLEDGPSIPNRHPRGWPRRASSLVPRRPLLSRGRSHVRRSQRCCSPGGPCSGFAASCAASVQIAGSGPESRSGCSPSVQPDRRNRCSAR